MTFGTNLRITSVWIGLSFTYACANASGATITSTIATGDVPTAATGAGMSGGMKALAAGASGPSGGAADAAGTGGRHGQPSTASSAGMPAIAGTTATRSANGGRP